MSIESRGAAPLIEGGEGDERGFESDFTHAGVEAMDAAESSDDARKLAALEKLEELMATSDVQRNRLPGEDEVFMAYQTLAQQLGKKERYFLDENGDIKPLAAR